MNRASCWKRWTSRAVAGSTILALAWLTAPALAGIVCYRKAITSWTQSGPPGGGCSSYNNCPDRILCVEGDLFDTSGTITIQTVECESWTGGTYDPIKKVCVGGTKVNPTQTVNIYVQDCSGSCN